MDEKQLIDVGRYYDGKKECGYTGTKKMLWIYEKLWVEHMLSQDNKQDDLLFTNLTEYLLAGLKDFEKFDGIPVTLKALLYNRFEQWDYGGSFKEFYRKYYTAIVR